jgi:drug/metabolite transporter (DMT)-like permease
MRGVVLVLISAAGFGLMPIFATLAYGAGFTPLTLLMVRFLAAAGLMFGLLAVRGGLSRPGRADLARLLLLGAVLYCAQSFLYFTAVRYVSPALVAVLLYLYPAFVTVGAWWLDRRPVAPAQILAMAISFTGIVVTLGTGAGDVRPLGVTLALLAAAVYAVYILTGSRLPVGRPPLETSAFVTLFAGGSFTLLVIGAGQVHLRVAAGGWWALGGVVLFSTVVAIICFFAGLARLGPGPAAMLSMIEPVVTVAAAALFLHATLTLAQLLGAAAVIAGALLGIATVRPPAAT